MVGEDAVFDAALRRAGVIRLYNLGQLFAAANAVLPLPSARQPPRQSSPTAAGRRDGCRPCRRPAHPAGPALSDATVAKLNEILPSNWSHCNPIDIIGDADVDRYRKTSKSYWPTRTSKACSPCSARRP